MPEIRRNSAFYFKVVLKRHIECRAAPESCLEERAQPFLEEVPDGLGLRKYMLQLRLNDPSKSNCSGRPMPALVTIDHKHSLE